MSAQQSSLFHQKTVRPYQVHLEMSEFLRGIVVGLSREAFARWSKLNTRAAGRDPALGWSRHIEGACAELAVAKLFGVHWRGVIGLDDRCDVARIEVKHTELANGRLLIRDEFSDTPPYVLVTGQAPALWCVGWLFGRECKRPEWRASPQPGKDRECFMVPREALRDLATLPPACLVCDEAELGWIACFPESTR